jgi:hypothetical protein
LLDLLIPGRVFWGAGLVLPMGFGWWGVWLIAQLDWTCPSGLHLMYVPLLHEQWRGRYDVGHASPVTRSANLNCPPP